MLTSTEAMAA